MSVLVLVYVPHGYHVCGSFSFTARCCLLRTHLPAAQFTPRSRYVAYGYTPHYIPFTHAVPGSGSVVAVHYYTVYLPAACRSGCACLTFGYCGSFSCSLPPVLHTTRSHRTTTRFCGYRITPPTPRTRLCLRVICAWLHRFASAHCHIPHVLPVRQDYRGSPRCGSTPRAVCIWLVPTHIYATARF